MSYHDELVAPDKLNLDQLIELATIATNQDKAKPISLLAEAVIALAKRVKQLEEKDVK